MPLSSAQQRLWFLNRLDGPSATYNIPLVLSLHGDLDVAALEAALRDLIERHESLRTICPEHDGQPSQLILGPGRHRLQAPRDRRHRRGRRRAAHHEAASEPFDVQTDLPTRATLLRRRGRRDHKLILVIHHIAADGWSMASLARDLETAYRARTRPPPPPGNRCPSSTPTSPSGSTRSSATKTTRTAQ